MSNHSENQTSVVAFLERGMAIDPGAMDEAAASAFARLVDIRGRADEPTALAEAVGAVDGMLGFIRACLGARSVQLLLAAQLYEESGRIERDALAASIRLGAKRA